MTVTNNTGFKIKGALPGTPDFFEEERIDSKTKKPYTEKIRAHISGICLEGRHELVLDPEGYVVPGQCRGGGRPSWGAVPWFCGCACHRYIRGLPPDQRVFDFPMDRERDPLQPTLAEELRAWAEERGLNRVPLTSDKPVVEVTPDSITDNGNRMRGALELQVLTVCQSYDQGEFAEFEDWALFTTLAASEAIAREYGCREPSQGAIHYIWTKWEAIGFAYLATKPFRFMTFTEAGKKFGLETLKKRAQGTV